MSTTIKDISMLPMTVQILMGLLAAIVICVLVAAKLAIGWWMRMVDSVSEYSKNKASRE